MNTQNKNILIDIPRKYLDATFLSGNENLEASKDNLVGRIDATEKEKIINK